MADDNDSTDDLKKIVLWLTQSEIDRLMQLLAEHPEGFVSFREYLAATLEFDLQEAVSC
jgi:hypothetical protein